MFSTLKTTVRGVLSAPAVDTTRLLAGEVSRNYLSH